jgi:glyoxylase-like metal-dependent hydrolase (beta-lactamase superfamily II)
MNVETFYDPATSTLTYAVYDPTTRDAIVIDPVLDFDPLSARTQTASVEKVDAFLRSRGLRLHAVLETHAHADHLSASQWLKKRHGARVAIGARIVDVQRTFQEVFDLGPWFATDGSQFDVLLDDGQVHQAGSLAVRVIATLGHTPACVAYLVGDAVFTGDALFMDDYGTGRCDFPGGSAEALYSSIHDRLYALPDATRVFVGHDYQPGGRPLRFETTILAAKERNVQLRASTSREAFVALRRDRDRTLAAPRLLYPSVQVNIDAGRLPPPRADGERYLVVPLNRGRRTGADGGPPDSQ